MCIRDRAEAHGRDAAIGDPVRNALRLSDAVLGQGRVELPLQPMLEIPSGLPVPSQEQMLWHVAILRNHALRMAQLHCRRTGEIAGA